MDTQAKKIIGNVWAINAPGERQTPEDVGIVRGDGWDLDYEQAGTFKFPERKVINQLLCEITSALNDKLVYGLCRWDVDVDWEQHDFITHEGNMYVALQASGPGNGGAEEPGTGTKWRLY